MQTPRFAARAVELVRLDTCAPAAEAECAAVAFRTDRAIRFPGAIRRFVGFARFADAFAGLAAHSLVAGRTVRVDRAGALSITDAGRSTCKRASVDAMRARVRSGSSRRADPVLAIFREGSGAGHAATVARCVAADAIDAGPAQALRSIRAALAETRAHLENFDGALAVVGQTMPITTRRPAAITIWWFLRPSWSSGQPGVQTSFSGS